MGLTGLLGERRVVFFGGKGGVGKTTVSSACALALARAGRSVLVVSTDPAHNLGHLWGTEVGAGETLLWGGDANAGAGAGGGAEAGAGSVTGMEIDPDAVAQAHLSTVGRTVKGMMPEHLHREVDRYFALARQSPGTQEAALLERMSEVVLDGLERYDAVLFDTAPTGHTARLLELPQLMSAWTEGLLSRRTKSERFSDAMRGLEGRRADAARSSQEVRDAEIRRVLERRRDLFVRMRELLTDAQRTAFVMVLAAERMPVLETVELHGQLRGIGVDVAAAVVNRRSPTDAGEFLAGRSTAEEEHVAELRRQVPGVPVVQLPLLPGEVTGAAAVERFAALLD